MWWAGVAEGVAFWAAALETWRAASASDLAASSGDTGGDIQVVGRDCVRGEGGREEEGGGEDLRFRLVAGSAVDRGCGGHLPAMHLAEQVTGP
jgi:hypothetical protein